MMINTNEPTCPTCGGTLISTSHFDVESMDNGQITMSVVTVAISTNGSNGIPTSATIQFRKRK